jgi:8-oxo-dGTP diphosphatase
MIRTCLCFIRRATADGPQVLLGLKKTGFGTGRWVGLGGHIEPGEKPAGAAAREVAEESSLIVSPGTLEHMASIGFRFPDRPSWDQSVEVYLTDCYSGELAESDEIAPRWYPEDELPLAGMWDDAKYWLPRVLAGQRVTATITFAADCASVASIEPDLLLGPAAEGARTPAGRAGSRSPGRLHP